jgi:serine/threonine-protein kinase
MSDPTPDVSPHANSQSVTRLAASVRVLIVLASVLTVVLMAWFLRRATVPRSAVESDASVGMMPFVLSADDTANAYLAEGVAFEVAHALSATPGLRVVAPVIAAGADTAPIDAVPAGAVPAGAVLTGTLARAGARVRVTAALTNARTGVVLWDEKYDRDARLLYTVHEDIARAIVRQMQLAPNPGAVVVVDRGTRDGAAYDLFLRGTYAARRARSSPALMLLQQAVARDSTFARAQAALVSARRTTSRQGSS